MIEKRNFYINGAWTSPAKACDITVINPSVGEPCAMISAAGEEDVNAAVNAARAAFDSWGNTDSKTRTALLQKLLDTYNARADEMAELISMEMGAPRKLARAAQVAAGDSHIRDFIQALESFDFERSFAEDGAIFCEPVGVCALITPWNWPMNQITLKVCAALAAGCTTVLKPSELAPLSAMLFAEMIDEAGFPAGVFNLINGDGAGAGTMLSGHPDIDMVSFTGSARAGAAVSKNAADSIKRVSLELGGKGANIIFADADENAVVRGARHCFRNTGQSCNAPTRMLAERAAYDAAVAAAVKEAEQTTVDDADKDGRHIGPAVSEAQFDKIQSLIRAGIDEGARLVAGGLGRPEGMTRGYFVRPTVFADVKPDMQIAREEIFGPVLCVMPFDSEDEAVAIANDTVYGLANYVQTQDADKARRVARRLRSGMVHINGSSLAGGAPFGGYKQSGNGREGGVWGLEDFLEVKAVSGWTK